MSCNYMPTKIECSKKKAMVAIDTILIVKKNISKADYKLFSKLIKLLPNLELRQHITEIGIKQHSKSNTITFVWELENISGTVKIKY